MSGEPAAGSEWRTYGRLVRYARPYAGRLVVAAAAAAVFGACHGGIIWAVRSGFGRTFDPAGTPFPVVLLFALAFPLLALFRGVADYVNGYLVRWVGNRVIFDLRNQAFTHVLGLSVSFFSGARAGDLISRVVNDSMLVERAVSTVVADILKQPFALVAMLVSLFWLDPRLSLISILLVPTCLIPVRIFGRRLRRNVKQGQERVADLTSILQEAIGGIRIVKAFGMEEYEAGRFRTQNRVFFSRSMGAARARISVDPIIVLLACFGIAMVLLYARWVRMPVGDFIAFAAALFLLYEPVKKLSNIHLYVQESSAAADRIFELLDAPVTVRDRPGAAPFAGEVREVQFDDVGFAYDETPVLRHIDFSVRAGTRVALVGGSGAGKTTLVNLLPRFADVTQGAIRIDGTDIRDMTLESLRRAIGMVTQETVLFNDTVANNIAYGTAGADREAVRAAARRAHAEEFILAMPQGYETVIGEHGVRLSGGQRQRLAIARAVMRNPPILILDEATSALDTESERMVQAALDELIAGRTVFVIAHRLSTIVNADVILVLGGGGIVERGSHAELLARDGVYRRLYELQFRIGAAEG